MLRLAVCDSGEMGICVRELQNCCGYMNIQAEVDVFVSAKKLKETISEGTAYDAVFLEIDKPQADGIKLGGYMRRQYPDLCFLYIIKKEELVFESLETRPFRSIRRSHMKEEFGETMLEIWKAKQGLAPKIIIESGNILTAISPMSIVYVEVQDKVLMVVGEERTSELQYTMAAMEDKLTDYGFIRIHKGYLVNIKHILGFDKDDVILSNGKRLPVSRRMGKKLKDMKALNQFQQR